MQLLKSLALAFACFTQLPAPQVEWERDNMRFMIAWLPVVGLAVGAFTCLWWLLAEFAGFGPALKAVGVALVPLAVTGGFHLDGFADVVDAQSSHAEPARKREILKDSHIGAFAAMGVAAYLLLYFGVATELAPGWRTGVLLVCLHALSRCGSAFASSIFWGNGTPGTLAMFRDSSDVRVTAGMAIGFFAVIGIAAVAICPACGLSMMLVEALLLVWLNRFAQRNFGGMSGDIAGFFLQACELLLLVCLMVASKAVGL